jgi:hypothetical protein
MGSLVLFTDNGDDGQHIVFGLAKQGLSGRIDSHGGR